MTRQGTTPRPLLARLGGLLSLAVLLTPLVALGDGPTLPTSRLGTRVMPLLLLSRSDVRADLKLSAEQATQADREIRELYHQAEGLKNKADAPQIIAARAAIDARGRQWIETQLSVTQRARLTQIVLQWEGPEALVKRPVVADLLNLSDAQRQALAQAVARRDTLRAQGKRRIEDERVLAEQSLSVLTVTQREKWQAMLGPVFHVQDPPAATASAPSNPKK